MSDDDHDEGYDEAQRIPWFWRDLFLRRVSPAKHKRR
jgi:hypothetical protein